MLSRDEAVAAALDYVRKKVHPDEAASVVMLPDTAIDHPYGWTVCFDLKEHIETGDFTKKPFSPVVVVPHDGTPAHMAPTFPATEKYMAMRASGDWPPKKGR